MNYLALRPAQFRQAISKCPVAYLPLGTLEWHGEHLPLGSDALQAHSFFLRAAAELGGIVVPPLFLGPDVKDADDLIGMDTCPVPGEPYPKQKLEGSAYGSMTKRSSKSSRLAWKTSPGLVSRSWSPMGMGHRHGLSGTIWLSGRCTSTCAFCTCRMS